MAESEPRIVFTMVDEETFDNLVFARENMEKAYNIKIQNVSDVIATLLTFWFEGKRK
jgi:hypothetical protein